MEEKQKGNKIINNSKLRNKEKCPTQINNNSNYYITPNTKINKNNKPSLKQESHKNISNLVTKPSNNLYSIKQNSKPFKNDNKDIIKNINKNTSNANKTNKNIEKSNNLNNLNSKINSNPPIIRKNTFNQLKLVRKNSGAILNKKITNQQKEKDRKLISERISNKDKNFNIKRNNTATAKRIIKNKNTEKDETKENAKENGKVNNINEIKILNKEITNDFSIFHFFKTNNIFFFIKNSKYNSNELHFKSNNNFEIVDNYTLPQAYRPRMNFFANIPKCIIDTCKKGNISMIQNFDNCNIIWKLLHPDKMRLLIRGLSLYQKFNHFPCTYQLGRKDNLFKHYKYYKRIVPDSYNYLPQTFILPMDTENFENELKKSKKSIWIVKPVNLSRGRGIRLICGENEYKNIYKKINKNNNKDIKDFNYQVLMSKYLDKPHLLNNKKYDLRIYVLVGSFTPLKIYLYYNGLVRFATENYTKGNYDNVFIHLTNYSINKKNPNYKKNLKNNKEIDDLEEIEEDNEQDDDASKWSLVEYKNYFKKTNINDFDKIWKQIEDIVIKTFITVFEYNCREMSGNKNNNLFELYGFDILIDESLKAWLLEVNVNPSLHCTSPLDLSIKTDLIIDVFNVVGISPFNHNNNEELYNYNYNNNNSSSKKNDKKDKEIKLPKIKMNNNNKNNNLINNKLKIEKNFDQNNLKAKMPEYNDEYYKNMITMFNEEKLRAETTGFTLIFPKKENVEYYANIMNKNNYFNDANIVLWEYILNNE